jgi:hypothetical protein
VTKNIPVGNDNPTFSFNVNLDETEFRNKKPEIEAKIIPV